MMEDAVAVDEVRSVRHGRPATDKPGPIASIARRRCPNDSGRRVDADNVGAFECRKQMWGGVAETAAEIDHRADFTNRPADRSCIFDAPAGEVVARFSRESETALARRLVVVAVLLKDVHPSFPKEWTRGVRSRLSRGSQSSGKLHG